MPPQISNTSRGRSSDCSLTLYAPNRVDITAADSLGGLIGKSTLPDTDTHVSAEKHRSAGMITVHHVVADSLFNCAIEGTA